MIISTFETESEILGAYAKRMNAARLEKLAALGLKIVAERSEGAKIFDINEKAYYDCFCAGGQYVLGHRKPEMIDALRKAVRETDIGNFPMISKQKAALAKKLAEITPGDLKCSVFGVSRGESVDFSMKLTRGATGRKEFICFQGGSHGQTGFALSASDNENNEKFFGPLIPRIKRIPLNSDELHKNISDKTAGVLIEPVQSDAGVVFPPKEILSEARKLCDRHEAALIFDEGQTGFGRTGKMFACEISGVTPDILVISKGMGGTVYPISAAVFTPRMNRFMLTHTLIHLSTFGGADVGCIVALAAIDCISKNKLWDNAKARGRELLEGLEEIASDNEGTFKSARGVGLLCAIETKDAATAEEFTRNLAANGVIALPSPGNPAAVRFTPSIEITADEVDDIIVAAETAAKACRG